MADLQLSPEDFVQRLPLAVCVCNREGAIVQYNRRAAALWGREPNRGELFCTTLRILDSLGRPLKKYAFPMAEVLRSGIAEHNRELVMERPDGSRITVLSNVAPLFDDAGRCTGAIDLFQDITDRKRSEEARRVAERLSASARMAASVVQRIDTPLSCMSKLLDALRQDVSLSAESRSYAQLAEEELSRLGKMAREMRHWSSVSG